MYNRLQLFKDVAQSFPRPLHRSSMSGAGIEGIKVVDARDAVAIRKEAAAQVPTDETGPAGDADVHR